MLGSQKPSNPGPGTFVGGGKTTVKAEDRLVRSKLGASRSGILWVTRKRGGESGVEGRGHCKGSFKKIRWWSGVSLRGGNISFNSHGSRGLRYSRDLDKGGMDRGGLRSKLKLV